jgi:hypothetical protein
MAINKTLLDELSNGSVLALSLRGLRLILEREFGLSNILIVTDDQIKQEQARQETKTYPYGFFSLNEFALDKDRQPIKNIRRHGWRYGLDEVTYSTTKKAYIFPIHIGVEFKYYESDPYKAILIAELMSMLSSSSALNFTIKLSEDFSYDVKIDCPDSLTIPLGQANDPANPGAFELVFNFVLNTWGGFVREVSAVNSDCS